MHWCSHCMQIRQTVDEPQIDAISCFGCGKVSKHPIDIFVEIYEGQLNHNGRFVEMDVKHGDTNSTGSKSSASTQHSLTSDDEDAKSVVGQTPNRLQDFDVDLKANFDVQSWSRWRKSVNSFDFACMPIAYAKRKRARRKTSVTHEDPFSMSKAAEILASIPEVSNELYVKAGEKMILHPSWREFFIKSPPDRRLGLLDNLKK